MAIFNGWRITRAGVVFVLGILVLAGLVLGGIWVVRERAEQARRDEAIKIASENLEEESEEVVTPANQEVSAPDEEDKGASAGESPAPTEELPATGGELSGLLAVTVLSLAAALYVTSRRAAREL